MQLKSTPLAIAILAASATATSSFESRSSKDAARFLEKLRVPRRNHGTFEELSQDNLQRECDQEICDREEMAEIYPEDEQAAETEWAIRTNQCSLNPCDAAGTTKCIQRWKKRTCVCKNHKNTEHDGPRFEGDTCETDVDECTTGNNNCNGAMCKNTIGSFECGCEAGYEEGSGGESCVDINECENMCNGPNEVCTNLPGTHSCDCVDGFHRDENNICVDDNECDDVSTCSAHPSGLNYRCENIPGSYACVCDEPGYRQGVDGVCEDINECETTCSGPTHQCINTLGSYECLCDDSGYENINDVCTDIDECATPDACMLGECFNTEGSYECCNTITHDFNNVTGDCSLKDPCQDVVCGLDQECTLGVCICTKGNGYEKLPHEGSCVDIDECASIVPICGTQECVNTDGSYYCYSTTTTPAPTTTPEPTTTTQAPTTTTKRKRKCRRRRPRDAEIQIEGSEEFECEADE